MNEKDKQNVIAGGSLVLSHTASSIVYEPALFHSELRFLIQISKWPIDGSKLKVANRSIFV